MSNRKVTYVKTHNATPLHIVGIGDLGSTLPPNNTKNIDGCVMVEGINGVEVSGSVRDVKFQVCVVYSSISHYLFEPNA